MLIKTHKELVSLWSVVELVRAFLAGSFYQVISITMMVMMLLFEMDDQHINPNVNNNCSNDGDDGCVDK